MGARKNGALKGEHAPSHVARPFLSCAHVTYKCLLRQAQSSIEYGGIGTVRIFVRLYMQFFYAAIFTAIDSVQ